MKKALLSIFLILMLCISCANSKAVFAGGAVTSDNEDIYDAFVSPLRIEYINIDSSKFNF